MNYNDSTSYNSFSHVKNQVNEIPVKNIKSANHLFNFNQGKTPNNNNSLMQLEISDDPFVISSDSESIKHEPENSIITNFHETQKSAKLSAQSIFSLHEVDYVTYRCQKTKTTSFGRKQIIFHLTDPSYESNSIIFYSAKFRSSGINPSISIFKGSSGHIKEDNADGIILTSDKLTNFSLRKQSRYGNELMSLKFSKSISNIKKPRSIQIYATIDHDPININDNSSKTVFLRNLEPQKTPFGTWQLNLNATNVKASSKNCRIINDSTKETVFILRKVKKGVIEIEALKSFSLLQLFALAISSSLCNLK